MILKYEETNFKQFDLKKESGQYYFDVILIGKTKGRTEEVYLKLELPTFLNKVEIESPSDYLTWNPILYADLGFGKLRIKDDKFFVKEVEQTMTLSEIEKKLGYKVNLVSENGRE